MALHIGMLQAPGDVSIGSGGGNSYGRGGGQGGGVFWKADTPHVFAIAGMQQELELYSGVVDKQAVTDFMLRTQKEFAADYEDMENGQFFTRRGASAKGMTQEYREYAASKWEQSPLTDRQKQQATPAVAALFTNYAERVARFEADNLLVDAKNRAEIAVYDAINLAATGGFSMQALSPHLGSLQDAMEIRASLEGWDADYTRMMLENAQGKMIATAAASMAETNPGAALARISEFKDMVPAAMYKEVQGRLSKAAEAQAKQADKVRLQGMKEEAIAMYSGLPPGEAATAALTDPALKEHPDIQKSVVEFFDWREREVKKVEDRAEKAQLQAGYDAVTAALAGKDLAAVDAVMASASPENQGKLQAYANRLRNGDYLKSDPVVRDYVIGLIDAGAPVDIEAEYSEDLSLQDIRRLKKMQANRQLAEYTVREKDFFSEEAKRYRPSITQREESALFTKFEASIPEGGYKDPAQREKALKNFWRKVVVDKPWSLSQEVRGFQMGEYAEKGYYPSLGEEYRELVDLAKAAIKEREGVEREPTEQELIRLSQQIYGVGK